MFAAVRVTAPITRAIRNDLESRIREMDPAIGSETPRFKAAMLLFALTLHPPQIDHLSCSLVIPREFLARCMRRLVDNGVLQNDVLVGGWSMALMVPEAFWADVNVATGKWLRRHDSRGSLEWTEAGAWQKPYDYTAPESVESSNRYIVSDGSRRQLLLECTASDSFVNGGWIGMAPTLVFGGPPTTYLGGSEPAGTRAMAGSGAGGEPMAGTGSVMGVWLS